MIKERELISLVLALIVISFSNSYFEPLAFGYSIIFFTLILGIYTVSKKVMASYLEVREETEIWSFQRYGFLEKYYFKTPIPIGLILAFILPILSVGLQLGFNIPWFAVLASKARPLKTKAARKHDIYSFAEIREWDLALIAGAGIVSMFILSIIAYLINIPELFKLSIYYACFNLLPLGTLDGTKIFFGSRKGVLWFILAGIALVGLLFYALIL